MKLDTVIARAYSLKKYRDGSFAIKVFDRNLSENRIF